MPSYRYNPDLSKLDNKNILNTYTNTFEALNDDNSTTFKKVFPNQIFASNVYLSKKDLAHDSLEFVSDEPFVSPIIFSYIGKGKKDIELDDYGYAIDVYVSIPNGSKLTIWFNNNKEKQLLVQQSGTIFRSITLSKIRTISTNCADEYCIAILDSNQMANNNA